MKIRVWFIRTSLGSNVVYRFAVTQTVMKSEANVSMSELFPLQAYSFPLNSYISMLYLYIDLASCRQNKIAIIQGQSLPNKGQYGVLTHFTLKAFNKKNCRRKLFKYSIFYYHFFSEKISLGISCESSARQMNHMECQPYFL